MTLRRTISLAIFALLAAAPAAGQEQVLGFLEGPNDGLNAGVGAIGLTGWALATSGVERVVIQVDGIDVGQAGYGGPRPLVEDLFPGFPDSAGAGFGYNLNSTEFPNGVHEISAKVTTNGGVTVVIPAVRRDGTVIPDGRFDVHFNNNTAILVPFGDINRPERNAELYGTCDRTNPFRRYTPVAGWVLDLGVEIGDAGVGWVELLVDGAIVANTRIDCRFDIDAGGLTDCYGLQRLDVERRFPFALDAPNAGFRFAIDVGFLLDNGFAQGHHTLTIRAGDISNQTANVAEIPVTFFCLENLGNESGFGRIESPRPGRQYADLVTFQGWALDGEGVLRVELFIDGESIGDAAYGLGQGTRPGVLARYPGFPDSMNPVWRLSDFDTRSLSDGSHQLQVHVIDAVGDRTLIGESTFFVENVFD